MWYQSVWDCYRYTRENSNSYPTAHFRIHREPKATGNPHLLCSCRGLLLGDTLWKTRIIIFWQTIQPWKTLNLGRFEDGIQKIIETRRWRCNTSLVAASNHDRFAILSSVVRNATDVWIKRGCFGTSFFLTSENMNGNLLSHPWHGTFDHTKFEVEFQVFLLSSPFESWHNHTIRHGIPMILLSDVEGTHLVQSSFEHPCSILPEWWALGSYCRTGSHIERF